MKSSEEIFYEKHNRKQNLIFRKNLKKIERDYFFSNKRYSIIKNTLNKNKKYNLLVEIGAGRAETLYYLNNKFKFNKLIGFDVVKFNSIKNKRIKLKKTNLNNNFPLKSNSVDCFIAMMVIEHLFDPFHSFSEINRVLKKDGLAFINLPLISSLKNRLRLLFGKIPVTSVSYNQWFKDKEWDGNHLHYFTLNSIYRICAINNLKIIKLNPVGNFYFIKKIFPSLFSNEISFCVKKI